MFSKYRVNIIAPDVVGQFNAGKDRCYSNCNGCESAKYGISPLTWTKEMFSCSISVSHKNK